MECILIYLVSARYWVGLQGVKGLHADKTRIDTPKTFNKETNHETVCGASHRVAVER